MSERTFTKLSFILTAVIGILVFTGSIFAQGRSNQAFERVRQVQERNTERFMAHKDVEGTAIGLDQTGQPVIAVFTNGFKVTGIPGSIEGVPVKMVPTGKFYALGKPNITPPGLANKAPKAPNRLKALAIGSSEIILNWSDNSTNETGFVIEFKDENGDFVEIGDVAANITSFSDSGLAPSTIYTYRVCAYNSSGSSRYSNKASAQTLPGSNEPIDPTARFARPVPIGVSTGNAGECLSGTIGCRLTDGTNFYALSNNHVYALENDAPFFSEVLQPGRYDTNCYYNSQNVIGTLAAYIPIVFHPQANNVVDAAIALCPTGMLGNATPSDGYGTPDSTTTPPVVGMEVMKYGRTTSLTEGSITYINSDVRVTYTSGVARFIGQIIISPGTFSGSGDSGSLIVTKEGNMPVGLMFAGSTSFTIANPIDPVLSSLAEALDVDELWIDDTQENN